MRFLSPIECQEWVKSAIGMAFTWESIESDFPFRVAYELPVDTGRKTALARSLSCADGITRPTLLWITAWGIWPSAENMAIFDGYRSSLGEIRPVHVAPGHEV